MESVSELEREALAKMRHALRHGYLCVMILTCVALLSWAAWMIMQDRWWPAAPAWVQWCIHFGIGLTLLGGVITVHRTMESHANCGSYQWPYGCALPRLRAVVLEGSLLLLIFPVFVVLSVEEVISLGGEFFKNAWAEHRLRRSPAASP